MTLHRLDFHQAAYAIFSAIADRPHHARFDETLPWLAKLAMELPEPADVAERITKYDARAIDALSDERVRFSIDYLLGRSAYRNHRYEDALRIFAKIPRGSSFYARAQLQIGVAHVLLRRTNPALSAFVRASGKS